MRPEDWDRGRRAMSIWMPAWSTDLLKRRERDGRDPRAVLLTERVNQRRIVARCCPRAHAEGVRVGMPAAQARALFTGGGVRLLEHRPDRDLAALRSLAVWAQRFSPAVAVEAPDGLLLNVTGCAPVFGGERRLIALARSAIQRLGFRCRIAVAPTYAAAWGLARFGEKNDAVIGVEDLRDALKPLPVRALGVPDETINGLDEIGIERIEHVLDLPRSALPKRFGAALLDRLDRALGQAMETIDPIRPTPPPVARRAFDGPTTQMEAIELTVRALLDEVAAALLHRESGAREISVEFVRSDMDPARLSIVLGRPSRDAKHVWSLVRPQLERVSLGFGVEGVAVEVLLLGALRHEQSACLEVGAGDVSAGTLGEMTDTLVNRLGADRVVWMETRESHLPERCFVMRPVSEGSRSRAHARITAHDRPTVLFDRPAPAEVIALTPDGPVHRVRWRGGDESVVACLGPERIGSEWWRGPAKTRDCFRVRCESGRWLWVVRSLDTGDWYVHGVWA